MEFPSLLTAISRSGIAITSGFAIKQCARLLSTVESSDDRDELAALQLRLESKIKILSPAIDMIELIAARGNTSLDSAVTLTKSIRYEIQSLGLRLSKAIESRETVTDGSRNPEGIGIEARSLETSSSS